MLHRLSRRAFVLVATVLCTAALPAVAEMPAMEFGKLPGVSDAAISPDGRQAAAFITVQGIHVIRVISIDKKDPEPRLIRLGDDMKPRWIRWANNEQILASLWKNEKSNGVPFTGSFIYTFNAKTLQGKILVKPKGVFRQYNDRILDWLEDDPDHILMVFSDSDQSISDIQKVNVKTGRYKRLRRGRSTIQQWYTDRRGEPRVGQGISDRSSDEAIYTLIIRDADSNDWRSHKEFDGLSPGESIFGFTDDPNELILGRFAGKPTLGLYVYDLVEQKITRTLFHDDRYDASDVVLTRDTGKVAGVVVAADEPEVRLFDGYDSAVQRARARFAGLTVDFVDQSANYKRVLMRLTNPSDPGVLLLWDEDTESYMQIAQYRSSMPPENLGNVVSARYPTRDGQTIPAYVTIPGHITTVADLKSIPFVVLPHGGPYAREYKRFDYFAQFFATRGFGVLQMNFRGSTGYGEAFEEAGRSSWALMHDDIEDGTRWLIEQGYADPERICIAGWSFGGYAALIGAIRNPDLYRCAVSIAGVTDLEDLVRDTRKYRFGRYTAKNSLLSGFADRDQMLELSPVRRVDELTIPVFLAHGELDVRVHFDQFRRMRGKLKKRNDQATFVAVDDDHFLSKQANRQKVFVELDDFLKRSVAVAATNDNDAGE
ncbi:MAG: prolyl oligopeptidase family serine peptidase [Pseudomonadota bacterium]